MEERKEGGGWRVEGRWGREGEIVRWMDGWIDERMDGEMDMDGGGMDIDGWMGRDRWMDA